MSNEPTAKDIMEAAAKELTDKLRELMNDKDNVAVAIPIDRNDSNYARYKKAEKLLIDKDPKGVLIVQMSPMFLAAFDHSAHILAKEFGAPLIHDDEENSDGVVMPIFAIPSIAAALQEAGYNPAVYREPSKEEMFELLEKLGQKVHEQVSRN